MILAVLADIHGNYPALEAVLREIDEEGIQTIVNAGDSVNGHPWPAETVDCINDRSIPTVQGESDRRALRFARKRDAMRKRLSDAEFRAIEETVNRCRSEHIEFLRRLPRTLSLSPDGYRVVVAHGTLMDRNQYLGESDTDEKFRRQREVDPADIYVLGGSHKAHWRRVDGPLFVDPGSVGYGTGKANEASYAIVNAEHETWTAELRTLNY